MKFIFQKKNKPNSQQKKDLIIEKAEKIKEQIRNFESIRRDNQKILDEEMKGDLMTIDIQLRSETMEMFRIVEEIFKDNIEEQNIMQHFFDNDFPFVLQITKADSDLDSASISFALSSKSTPLAPIQNLIIDERKNEPISQNLISCSNINNHNSTFSTTFSSNTQEIPQLNAIFRDPSDILFNRNLMQLIQSNNLQEQTNSFNVLNINNNNHQYLQQQPVSGLLTSNNLDCKENSIISYQNIINSSDQSIYIQLKASIPLNNSLLKNEDNLSVGITEYNCDKKIQKGFTGYDSQSSRNSQQLQKDGISNSIINNQLIDLNNRQSNNNKISSLQVSLPIQQTSNYKNTTNSNNNQINDILNIKNSFQQKDQIDNSYIFSQEDIHTNCELQPDIQTNNLSLNKKIDINSKYHFQGQNKKNNYQNNKSLNRQQYQQDIEKQYLKNSEWYNKFNKENIRTTNSPQTERQHNRSVNKIHHKRIKQNSVLLDNYDYGKMENPKLINKNQNGSSLNRKEVIKHSQLGIPLDNNIQINNFQNERKEREFQKECEIPIFQNNEYINKINSLVLLDSKEQLLESCYQPYYKNKQDKQSENKKSLNQHNNTNSHPSNSLIYSGQYKNIDLLSQKTHDSNLNLSSFITAKTLPATNLIVDENNNMNTLNQYKYNTSNCLQQSSQTSCYVEKSNDMKQMIFNSQKYYIQNSKNSQQLQQNFNNSVQFNVDYQNTSKSNLYTDRSIRSIKSDEFDIKISLNDLNDIPTTFSNSWLDKQQQCILEQYLEKQRSVEQNKQKVNSNSSLDMTIQQSDDELKEESSNQSIFIGNLGTQNKKQTKNNQTMLQSPKKDEKVMKNIKIKQQHTSNSQSSIIKEYRVYFRQQTKRQENKQLDISCNNIKYAQQIGFNEFQLSFDLLNKIIILRQEHISIQIPIRSIEKLIIPSNVLNLMKQNQNQVNETVCLLQLFVQERGLCEIILDNIQSCISLVKDFQLIFN